ncbi:MAG TPA: SCP2 sterol-binding domain-containing protein [Myxococcaceae bacterium]|nr:SCP2 sterol-binding domain-containing protein [Myxococcaceae bacterium]
MPDFPSRAWCEEALRLLETDPETRRAGEGWTADFGVVVDAEPGKLERPFVVYVRPVNGRVERWSVHPDPDDLDELDPVYRIRAPYSVWKGVLLGTVDPIEAVLRRRVEVQGDIQPLIEKMQHKGLAERVLAAIDTHFADDR